MSVTKIEVGTPHPMWTPQLHPGATFDDDIGLFVAGVINPSDRDLKEFEGPGRFGLMRHRQIAVFTLVLGEAIDFSVPYHTSFVSRVDPPVQVEADERRLLHFHLVDAASGETLGIRASTVSPHLTKVMQQLLQRQSVNDLSEQSFLTDVQHWDTTYPTPRSVRRASTWSRLGD